MHKLQFSMRAMFLLISGLAITFGVARATGTNVFQAAIAISSLPAFLAGPFIAVWAFFNWRDSKMWCRDFPRYSVSFVALAGLLFCDHPLTALPSFAIQWWFANLPGALIFVLVLANDPPAHWMRRRRTASAHPASHDSSSHPS